MILYVGANHLTIGHMTGNVGANDSSIGHMTVNVVGNYLTIVDSKCRC